MNKEEFPTFLNEQPKVIFGRTGRELLIIVLGIVGAYTLWGGIGGLVADFGWQVFSGILCALVIIASFVLAMVSVGNRPLEEWFAAWLTYTLIPKVYVYRAVEEDAREIALQAEEDDRMAQESRQKQDSQSIMDEFEL